MAKFSIHIKPISVIEATKQVPCCVNRWDFTPNGVRRIWKALYFENTKPNKWFSKLDLQRNPNGINGNNRVIWIALFYNTIQCNYYYCRHYLLRFVASIYTFIFGKKITPCYTGSKKLIHKVNKPKRIHRKKHHFRHLPLFSVFASILLLFLAFDVDFTYLT
jgi:hypothetical protein